MVSVVMVGALDTKGVEYGFVRDILLDARLDVVVIDTGVLGATRLKPDYTNEQVAESGGSRLRDLVTRADRGAALEVMTAGAVRIVSQLLDAGRVQGAIALGGTGGTAVASEIFRLIPLGIPKIIVSTAASGHTEPYVGESDLVLMPSITDVAGLNPLLRKILANAAHSLIGQVTAGTIPPAGDKPMIGASMFGVTTPSVTTARELLEQADYEVVVFHMTGVGGRSLEQLIRENWLDGVLDITTTELADELVGGVFDAGPTRLTGAAAVGIPQVVSVGALDMVNFGPRETVPPQFSARNLYQHNSSVTLMRTTPEESEELGRRLATRLSVSTGPTTLFLPLGGISAISTPGGPFYDPAADAALFDAIHDNLDTSRVELVERDDDINAPAFAHAMSRRLLDNLAERSRRPS